MAEEEILLVKRGQPHLGKGVKKVFSMLEKEKINLLFVDLPSILSEFLKKMPKETKLRNIDISYFLVDIFRDKPIEIVTHIPDTKAIEVFKYKLKDVREIIKVDTHQEGGNIAFRIFVDKPNWDMEERIYDAYGDLLDTFPSSSFSLEVIELFGKKVPAE